MTKISAEMAVPLFCRLCDIDIDKGQEYSCLCHTSYSEIQPLLTKSEFTQSECDRLIFLIAVSAFEKYLLLNLSRCCFNSVKVMDVTVKENAENKLSAAAKLKISAQSACSDLLKSPYFALFTI